MHLASKVCQLPSGSCWCLLIPSPGRFSGEGSLALLLGIPSIPVRATGSANGALQRPCRSPGLNPESKAGQSSGIRKPEDKKLEDGYQ